LLYILRAEIGALWRAVGAGRRVAACPIEDAISVMKGDGRHGVVLMSVYQHGYVLQGG